nr:hypothetical transcript [Hymenolepis microstoma]
MLKLRSHKCPMYSGDAEMNTHLQNIYQLLFKANRSNAFDTHVDLQKFLMVPLIFFVLTPSKIVPEEVPWI